MDQKGGEREEVRKEEKKKGRRGHHFHELDEGTMVVAREAGVAYLYAQKQISDRYLADHPEGVLPSITSKYYNVKNYS